MKLFTLLLFLILIIFVPLITVWALNTLFQLGIAYTMKSWLAVIILQSATFGGLSTTIRLNSNK